MGGQNVLLALLTFPEMRNGGNETATTKRDHPIEVVLLDSTWMHIAPFCPVSLCQMQGSGMRNECQLCAGAARRPCSMSSVCDGRGSPYPDAMVARFPFQLLHCKVHCAFSVHMQSPQGPTTPTPSFLASEARKSRWWWCDCDERLRASRDRAPSIVPNGGEGNLETTHYSIDSPHDKHLLMGSRFAVPDDR
ncbi:hypothetical protein ZHAS_00017021 [Anopheles sinensis]|uniref:Uncharacterized protein n=1 Tax=Anopheles sinensis TaxID=74873 RepID=A0A084WFL8_ANOSI|nr:hypothetical protein ZHAS_00017021 [Anopheles sinensis]